MKKIILGLTIIPIILLANENIIKKGTLVKITNGGNSFITKAPTDLKKIDGVEVITLDTNLSKKTKATDPKDLSQCGKKVDDTGCNNKPTIYIKDEAEIGGINNLELIQKTGT